jgi:hypothetical protein
MTDTTGTQKNVKDTLPQIETEGDDGSATFSPSLHKNLMIIHCTTELSTSPTAMMDRMIIVSANKTLLLLWVAHIPTLISLEG